MPVFNDTQGTVRVEGLTELIVAFDRLNRGIGKDIRSALESAAEPAKQDAARLAFENISGMSRSRIPWHSMRVGVTRTGAYIAPLQRGVKSKGRERARRPNLATLLLVQEIEGVNKNADKAEREVLDALDDGFRRWSQL